MKQLTISHILLYYEGPLISEALDEIGANYIVVGIRPEGNRDRFLVAGVSAKHLMQFRRGDIDLRTLILERPQKQWFIGYPIGTLEFHRVEIRAQRAPLGETGYLPDPGLFLYPEQTHDPVIAEARERNTLVCDLHIEPNEDEHKMPIESFVGVLLYVQRSVKYAFTNSLSKLGKTARKGVPTIAPPLAVASNLMPGSIRVLLEPVAAPGMFGTSDLARAFALLDLIFENSSDPDATAKIIISDYRGLLAGAIAKLLREMSDKNVSISYSWAEPDSTTPGSARIAIGNAKSMSAILDAVQDIGVQTSVYTGSVRQANHKTGTWSLDTDEGLYVTGKSQKGGPSLKHIVIGGRYTITCEEQSKEGALGQEKIIREILTIEPLDADVKLQ